jgi:hypothetical protein
VTGTGSPVLDSRESHETQGEPPGLSTTADALQVDRRRLQRGYVLRRTFIVLLVVFVAAAAVGVFGVRTRTVRASAGPLSAELEYAAINRRGVTSVWQLDIARRGGFDDDISVSLSQDYYDTLAFRGMSPDADTSSADGRVVRWTFTAPRSSTFTTRIDAQIDGASQPGRHRGTAVVRVGDEPPVTLHFTTWVLP